MINSDPRSGRPVLVVSASAGTGHISAGNALHAALEARGADAVHVDVLALAPRWVRAVYGGGFELLASRAPRVWRGVYNFSDGPDSDAARWGPVAQRVLFRAFDELLRAHPWQHVLCTHFLPGQLAAGHRGTSRFTLVITDFALHRYWVQPRVRHYFVAHGDMVTQLRQRLPGCDVTVSGIPVHDACSNPPSRHAARARHGLPGDARVAVVMGGGLGIGVEDAARAALCSNVEGLRVIAVCGRNEVARARLAALAESEPRLRVLPYVDGIHALLAAADAVVTKPGGLTCSEALALGLPLVLTRAIPGHEEANVRYLTRIGAAAHAPGSGDVGPALRRALLDPRIRDAARAAGRADAAAVIARSTLERHRSGVAA